MKDGWQELCETCLRERTIVALSSQGQSDGAFYCGFVQEVTDDSLLLVYVNQLGVWGEGSAEGAWFQFQEIDWIKFGTPYLRA